MLITMFTDISISRTQVAAYAVWAKEGGRTFRFSGLFKEPVSDSNYAEAAGIINGLFFVLRDIKPLPGSKIIVQSDSTNALDLLSGQLRSNTAFAAQARHLVERRDAILAGRSIEVDYRHVKGHRGTRTPRNAVNTWCNDECRRLLFEHRQTQGAEA